MDSKKKRAPAKKRDVVLVLHDIRSAHNVGAILRTADAAGVSKIYLTGYTPAPTDRFGRERRDVAKAALGAEKWVRWEQNEEILPLIRMLKKKGYRVIAVEQSPTAEQYRTVPVPRKSVFVFGNEVEGLPEAVLDAVHVVAEIPMRGKVVRQAHHPRHTRRGKESLNVSVAVGIALFGMLRL
ncbi:MAG: TrmH family RNA methyltransferase, partial [Patescibacteria group bacterium]